MGKRKYAPNDVSHQKTDFLALPNLLVLNKGSGGDEFHAVHQRYFKKEKSTCPACGSERTRSSKVIKRKLKDIIWRDDGSFKIVTITFNQCYFRCDECKDSVFPEEIDFAEKGCKYTNRLADALADGTLRQSYSKVCKHYGVPASTASVGDIMRRRIKFKELQLPEIETPSTLSIVEIQFNKSFYPIVLAIHSGRVLYMDILKDTSEETYITFFKTLDSQCVEMLYIDPGESLRLAVDICFPEAVSAITGECIERFARNALIEIIKKDGKRFPLKNKIDKLVLFDEYLSDSITKRQMKDGFSNRPRLKCAYEKYQQLLHILDREWSYESLFNWSAMLPDELPEFNDLRDLVELHENEIKAYLSANEPPVGYVAAISGVCKAIEEMPHCIFDVLRARCMLTVEHDLKEENGEVTRLGIDTTRFSENLNKISKTVRELKDPYSD